MYKEEMQHKLCWPSSVDQLSCPAKVKKCYTYVETFSFALAGCYIRLTLKPAPGVRLELPDGPAKLSCQA